jgi:hypothetical protein
MNYKWLFESWSKSKIKIGEMCVYGLILQAKGVKQPINIYAEVGNEIHKFLEEYVKLYLKRKIEIENLRQLLAIKQHYTIENFVLLEEERLKSVESLWWDVEHYIDVFIPIEKLVEMDEEWLELRDKIFQLTNFQFSGLLLKGFIDRVDDLYGEKILVDYKTGSLDYVDMDEMWFYALLWWLKYNQIPKIVVLYGLKEGKMKYEIVDGWRLQQYYQQILNRIKNTIISILKFLETGELKKKCEKCWWRGVCDISQST